MSNLYIHSILRLLIVCLLTATIRVAEANNPQKDSLWQIIENTKNDSIRANAYLELGYLYNWGNTTKMEEMGLLALKIGEQHHWDEIIFNANRLLSSSTYVSGEYDKGLKYAKEALAFARKNDRKKEEADILNTLGLLYTNLHDFETALDYFLQVYDTHKKLKNERIDNVQNNIANCYMFLGQFEESLAFRNKAIALRKSSKNFSGLGDCYNDLGEMYLLQNELDSAIFYLKNAYRIKEDINDEEMMCLSALNLTEAYMNKKRYADARKYANTSLFLAQKIGSKSYQILCYNKLADIANVQLQFKEESEFLRKYIALKEELSSEESKKQINRLHAEFETEKKELHIKSLETEQQLQQQKRAEEKIRNYLIGGFLGILLLLSGIFSYLISRRYKLAKKQREKIHQQKQIIENKQKEVLDSIRYAKRIQDCMLPTEKIITKKLNLLKKRS